MTTSQHALSTNFAPQRIVIAPPQAVRRPRRLISRQGLRRALGALWLLDGLLQLQPSMFTSNLITGIMQPATQGQPGLVADTIQPLINLTAHYLVPVNAMIALVQLALGVCLLGGWFVRPALLASIAWSFGVWYGGEGMGMILTGQASALTGAPGAVLLYALLGAAAYPRGERQKSRIIPIRVHELLSRRQLQRCLAGFWGLAAVLQLQPYWWQAHQISQAITRDHPEHLSRGRRTRPGDRPRSCPARAHSTAPGWVDTPEPAPLVGDGSVRPALHGRRDRCELGPPPDSHGTCMLANGVPGPALAEGQAPRIARGILTDGLVCLVIETTQYTPPEGAAGTGMQRGGALRLRVVSVIKQSSPEHGPIISPP